MYFQFILADPRSGTIGLYDKYKFKLLQNCRNAFHNGYIMLHSH